MEPTRKKTGPSLFRTSDLERKGYSRTQLTRLVRAGRLVRVARGLYAFPGTHAGGERALAEVASLVPGAVICLLSALRFHGLTTQGPSEVWIAIENRAWRPRGTPWPVQVVYMSGRALTAGVETHRIDGVRTRVFSAAKTVADCFKFRNRIGLDVAVEALRDYLRRNRAGADEVWRYAKICRVTRVIAPYLEAVR